MLAIITFSTIRHRYDHIVIVFNVYVSIISRKDLQQTRTTIQHSKIPHICDIFTHSMLVYLCNEA